MKKELSVWDLGGAFALLGMLATGMWAVLTPFTAALVVALYVLSFFLLKDSATIPLKPPVWSASDLGLSLTLLVPLTLYSILSWHSEFPLSGDHDHHTLAIESARTFWWANWPYLLGFLGAIGVGLFRIRARAWPLILLFAMILAPPLAPAPLEYFARYPAASYLFAQPFAGLAWLVNAKSYWEFDRLSNILAPFVWLLLLRPLCFGRKGASGWPVLAVLMLLQKDFIYFFDSVYLEAWSLTLLALALEALFLEDSPPWLATALSALACLFKDAAAIPFLCVSLASLVQRPRAYRQILGVGSLTFSPFIVFYLARQATGVWRTVGASGIAEWLTPQRLELLDFRLNWEFRSYGLTVLILLIFAGILNLGRNRLRVWTGLVVFAGGMFQLWFFFADRILLPFPGYPRVSFTAWITLLSPTILLPKRWALLGAGLLAIALLPPLIDEFTLLREPSFTRNFREDYGTAYFFPIRTLIEKAQVRDGETVRLIFPSRAVHSAALPLAYRDLFSRLHWEAYAAPVAPELCACPPGLHVLLLTPQARGLRAEMPFAPYPWNST